MAKSKQIRASRINSDEAIFALITDDKFAEEVFDWIANTDRMFEDVQRRRKELRKKGGRLGVWTKAAYFQLLVEYAAARDDGMGESAALKELGALRHISPDSVNNKMIEALKAIDQSALPVDARPAIAERRAKKLRKIGA